MVIAEKREKNKRDRIATHDADDTLVEDVFNNCDIRQEIQESENESGREEFPRHNGGSYKKFKKGQVHSQSKYRNRRNIY
nr:hypothetical protein CFP56_46217 [Quercus suber]